MAKIVQMHGMATSAAAVYVGPQREVIVDTGANALRVQDGATPGGFVTMQGGNNLSEVTNAALARQNLGAAALDGPDFTSVSQAPQVNGDIIVTENAAQTLNDKTFTDTVSIQFGASAHALAAYEEGTWVPVDASGAGLAIIGQGQFIKIGKIVFINCSVEWPVNASATNALIGGLPYTSAAFDIQPIRLGVNTAATDYTAQVRANTETFEFLSLSAAQTIRNEDVSNVEIKLQGFYFAAA